MELPLLEQGEMSLMPFGGFSKLFGLNCIHEWFCLAGAATATLPAAAAGCLWLPLESRLELSPSHGL